MKVGIDVSQVAFGSGVSDYTECLVNHLPLNMVHPFAFTSRSGLDIKNRISTAKIIPIPLSVMEFIGNTLHALPIELFAKSIDLYHSSDWIEFPSRVKKITTVHDLTPFLYKQETNPLVVSVHTRKMKWVTKETNHIICVSRATADDLMKLFNIPASKITIIPEALPDRFAIPAEKSEYSDYLVTMGSVQPRKNISRLVSTYLKYRSSRKLPSKLIVIGQTNIQFSDPNVICTGYISNQSVVNLIANAHAFVYPSIYEGFGLPALVSFYHKTPFIASNTSSLPEVVGEAGVLVDPYSEMAICDGIIEGIRQKKVLVEMGKKQLKKFSWETVSNMTEEVYKHV